MGGFKLKFEQKCTFQNIGSINFSYVRIYCTFSPSRYYLQFLGIVTVQGFFHTTLNLKKWLILNQNRNKCGFLQKIITSIVIYFEIYYTGSFSKYPCKILGILPKYGFHYNSSNLKNK